MEEIPFARSTMLLRARCTLAVAGLAWSCVGCTSVSGSNEVLAAEADAGFHDGSQDEDVSAGGSSGAGGADGSAGAQLDALSDHEDSAIDPFDALLDTWASQDVAAEQVDALDSSAEAVADACDAEGSADAPELPPGVVKIVEVSIPSSTGMAQQTHLIYATSSQRWWLFFEDADEPSAIHTRWSADFAQWTPGPDLDMPAPHGNDGRNLSVAFAEIEGHEIVHITYGAMPGGSSRSRYHARAEIAGTSITVDSPVLVNAVVMSDSDPVDPDGCVTAVSGGGEVVDLSSWTDPPDGGIAGGVFAWHSTFADDGASFSETWEPMEEAITGSYGRSHAKALIARKNGSWFAASNSTAPWCSTIKSLRSGGQWQYVAGPGFCAGFSGDPNDFSYQHTVYGAVVGVWRANGSGGGSLCFAENEPWYGNLAYSTEWPFEPVLTGAGVFLASDGVTFDQYAVLPDSTIHNTHWDTLNYPYDWSPWKTAVPSTGIERRYLAGYTDHTHTALIWTEPIAGGFAIMGYRLSP